LDEAAEMKPPPRPSLGLVALREIRFFRRDRAGYLLVIIVPLVAFAVLTWTFSSAVVRGLNVVVVDADRSETSAKLIQSIAAAPGLRVAERANELKSATRAIRSGQAIAAVYIPPRFEEDLLADRRPQIIGFYNAQYFTPGNIASRGLSDAISDAVSQLSPVHEVRLPTPAAGSLVVEQYVLTNPALNYAAFLLRAVMPTTLHVVIGIAAAYAVGTEFSRRSRRAWLRCAGGSPLIALAGKLLPLLALFFAFMCIEALILHAGFELPYRGSVLMMVVAAMLFIVAYQSLAALFVLLVRELALGLSLVAIISSPAFGYAGVGLPVLAMNGFAKAWGALLPIRWYQVLLFDQAARGSPVHASAPAFAILAGMAIGLFVLAWWRLSRLSPGLQREQEAALPRNGRGGVGAFIAEWRRVLADRGVFSLMMIAPVFYGVFYPQPYLGQLVRKIPIAVADDDRTPLSRRLIQALDADEAISVAVRAPALDVAQRALFDRRVFGILEIPPDTEREVLKGREARIPAYVDSAYFLVFNRTLQGIAEGASDTNVADISRGLRTDGAQARLALTVLSPAELLMEPLYNPTGGYASYVVPAAFVLIIQQTLLMGAATLTALGFERRSRVRPPAPGPTALFGRGLAHLTIYIPALAVFFVVLPHVYGFSTLGRVTDLALFAVPFVLATSFMGQAAGSFFVHRETAVLLFVATTLPQFFQVGVSWPREMLPPALDQLRRIFPSESAIDGLVRMGQRGARLGEVGTDWFYLWLLTAIYFALAVVASRRRAAIEAIDAV
jgi:ABC-2 type transport system permease protein